MTINEKIARYKEVFNNDPLYQKIKSKDKLDDLFNNKDFFESIDFTEGYSTKIAAELLGLESKEQTLINYINRNDFKDYIQITRRAGRFYRYDWKALFRFKMIFLLSDLGYSPMDIATLIGRVTDIVEGEGLSADRLNTPIPTGPSKAEIIEATKEEIYPAIYGILTYQDLEDTKRALLIDKSQIDTHLRHTEDMIKLYTLYLRDKQEYITVNQAKLKNDKGFLSSLFGNNKNNNSSEEIERAEAMKKEIADELASLNQTRESLLQEKVSIKEKLLSYEKLLVTETKRLKLKLEMNGEIEDDDVHEENE